MSPVHRVVPPVCSAGLTAAGRSHVLDGRKTRLDGGTVLMNAMGAEIELTEFFAGRTRWDNSGAIKAMADKLLDGHIQGKRVLVAPSYGTNAFQFGLMGAKEVVGVDRDPVTLAWLKTVRAYFHFDGIGNRHMLPVGVMERPYKRGIGVGSLEESLQELLRTHAAPKPLDNVTFKRAALGVDREVIRAFEGHPGFDFIYVPYLMGVPNGIQDRTAMTAAYEELWAVAGPGARMMVRPFRAEEATSVLPAGKFSLAAMMDLGGGFEAGVFDVLK